MNLTEYNIYKKEHQNSAGAPKVAPPSPPKSKKVCGKCLSDLKAGIPHECSRTQFKNNITEIVKGKSPNTRCLLAANILKNTTEETSFRGGVLELKSGANILPVTIGTPKSAPKKAKFTHNDLITLQTNNNFSDKSIK